MLRITIPKTEYYDEQNEAFVEVKEYSLQLEHSLVSLSKWEAKWHKPFLGKDAKTEEETLDYIRCMTITQNVPPIVYSAITPDIVTQINAYIEDSMTATWFNDKQGGGKLGRETITSELIYYWMVTLEIPFDCEKWHLNRLLTLVKVCNLKNSPGKKMSKKELMNRNRSLNAARRQSMNTKG